MKATEHQEQCTVVRWFDVQFPEFRGRLFAVPNGAHLAGTTGQRAAKMSRHKAEGLRPGVPDLWLPVARKGFHGLVIEMKREVGAKITAEQADWLEWLGAQGYMAVCCRGAEPAMETIKTYLRGMGRE